MKNLFKFFALFLLVGTVAASAGCKSKGGEDLVVDDQTQQGGGNDSDDPAEGDFFKFELNGTTLTVTSSHDGTYYWDVYLASYYDGMSDDDIVADDEALWAEYGYSLNDLLSYDDEYVDLAEYLEDELVDGEEYMAYAYGYANGKRTTSVSKYTFTYHADPSAGGNGGDDDDDDNIVEDDSLFKFDLDGTTLTVTSSWNSTYYWDVYLSSYYEGMSDSEIVADDEALWAEYGYSLNDLLSYDDEYVDLAEYLEDELVDGEEYMAYAYGYANGKRTTSVSKYIFTYHADPTAGGDDDDDDDNNGGSSDGVYVETFAGYTGGTNNSYKASDAFTSTATGVTWTVEYGVISFNDGNQALDSSRFDYENCFTMGGGSKDSQPDYGGTSTITTSVLKDGISKLSFAYIANSKKTMKVEVLVNGSTVWSSDDLALENNTGTQTPETLSFDITGAESDAVLKFTNVSAARRISIGNIKWTSAAAGEASANSAPKFAVRPAAKSRSAAHAAKAVKAAKSTKTSLRSR